MCILNAAQRPEQLMRAVSSNSLSRKVRSNQNRPFHIQANWSRVESSDPLNSDDLPAKPCIWSSCRARFGINISHVGTPICWLKLIASWAAAIAKNRDKYDTPERNAASNTWWSATGIVWDFEFSHMSKQLAKPFRVTPLALFLTENDPSDGIWWNALRSSTSGGCLSGNEPSFCTNSSTHFLGLNS